MIERKTHIDKIVNYISLFVQEVKSYNAINAYDINMHAEGTLIPILNAIYGLNLLNVNAEKKNHPAVDLVDKANRACFQVTATSDADKVTSTLEKFFRHNLHQQYDVLYIYILTEKEKTYPNLKIEKLLEGRLEFKAGSHIIDYSDILEKINSLPLEAIKNISKIVEHNFSNIQIETRKKVYQDGFLRSTSEPVYINMVRVEFSKTIYVGKSNVDYKEALELFNMERKEQNRRPIKKQDNAKLFAYMARRNNVADYDFVLRENSIITFRDLNDPEEALSALVEKGTIERFTPEEYYQTDEDHLRIFKDLLRRCLVRFCQGKDMEWVKEKGILRFKNFWEMPRSRSTIWVGKKESTKTVIFEMSSKAQNEKESHIICFRSMAFKPTFHLLGTEWFLAINPTYSFTNPGGYYTSKFEATYMTGIKRMENNSAVCNQYRFFAYFLSHVPPLFYEQYPFLKLSKIPPTEFSPALDDSKWRPPKEYSPNNVRELELHLDNELKSNMF